MPDIHNGKVSLIKYNILFLFLSIHILFENLFQINVMLVFDINIRDIQLDRFCFVLAPMH